MNPISCSFGSETVAVPDIPRLFTQKMGEFIVTFYASKASDDGPDPTMYSPGAVIVDIAEIGPAYNDDVPLV